MIGVVLWSDPDGNSAVFWCEDQGDLAYFERTGDVFVGGSLFVAGDMVQFDIRYDGKMRCAIEPRLLQEQVCQSLPSRLRQTAQAQPSQTTGTTGQATGRSAKVVPFEGRRATAAKPQLHAVKA
ncbi:hypothetical protein [uncultured Sulfitobacter sp.]|uniref:hypothetical protein n=1 Tax=uncultured Sulfitobacter sp. TaxID=191468 RepID=UPI002639EB8A|nr:hypothetical protein [uncultured Sulfitobacter sp.]